MTRPLVLLAVLLTAPVAAQPDGRAAAVPPLAVVVDVLGPDLVAGVGVRVGLGERWALTAGVSRHVIETEAPPDLYLGPGVDQNALGVEVGALYHRPLRAWAVVGAGLVASAGRQSGESGIRASGFYVRDGVLRSELIVGSYREDLEQVALQGALAYDFRVWRGVWVGGESRQGPARTWSSRSERVQFGDRAPSETADSEARWRWASDARLRAVVRF